MIWHSNGKEKRKNDQIDKNKKRATLRLTVRKWNAHVIWKIVNSDFYERIWK